jgi:hypothetical protein
MCAVCRRRCRAETRWRCLRPSCPGACLREGEVRARETRRWDVRRRPPGGIYIAHPGLVGTLYRSGRRARPVWDAAVQVRRSRIRAQHLPVRGRAGRLCAAVGRVACPLGWRVSRVACLMNTLTCDGALANIPPRRSLTTACLCSLASSLPTCSTSLDLRERDLAAVPRLLLRPFPSPCRHHHTMGRARRHVRLRTSLGPRLASERVGIYMPPTTSTLSPTLQTCARGRGCARMRHRRWDGMIC